MPSAVGRSSGSDRRPPSSASGSGATTTSAGRWFKSGDPEGCSADESLAAAVCSNDANRTLLFVRDGSVAMDAAVPDESAAYGGCFLPRSDAQPASADADNSAITASHPGRKRTIDHFPT